MGTRPITLLLLALAAVCSMPAQAAEMRRQAQLRISVTIVDSCDVELVRSRSGVEARDTRVECSSFMPHQATLAGPQSVRAGAERARIDLPGSPPSATLASLAGPYPADRTLRTASGTVTVATVIF